MFARLFIRELIGSRACPSAARPIGERNAFLGAGARVQGNILNLSDDSLSFSVVRSSSKSNVRPSRTPLTLVGYTWRTAVNSVYLRVCNVFTSAYYWVNNRKYVLSVRRCSALTNNHLVSVVFSLDSISCEQNQVAVGGEA